MTAPINPVIPRVVAPQDSRAIPMGDVPNGTSFKATLAQALGDVNDIQNEAQQTIAAMARGENVSMHDVMMASEEAALSLELLVEMRNKLTEAYRTIMNMQV